MSEPNEAAKVKACELLNAAYRERHPNYTGGDWVRPDRDAQCPAMKPFASYIQAVSDAAKAVIAGLGEPGEYHRAHLGPFILPDPVDPLEAFFEEIVAEGGGPDWESASASAQFLRTELAKRGLKIVEAQP